MLGLKLNKLEAIQICIQFFFACNCITFIYFTLTKGSNIEVYSRIEFPKYDFQFNYDTKCRVYVAILHHSGLSYNMFE